MNMAENMVINSPAGFTKNLPGIKDHERINASPPVNSRKKINKLSAIKAYVMIGKVFLELLSSLIGSITILYKYAK
jgi:hypothetical protein